MKQLTKLLFATLLLGFGLQAHAHNLNWAVGIIDCDTKTIALKFQVDGFRDNYDYQVNFELFDSSGASFASGSSIVFQGNGGAGGTEGRAFAVTPYPVVDVSGVSGIITGTAALIQLTGSAPGPLPHTWGADPDPIQGRDPAFRDGLDFPRNGDPVPLEINCEPEPASLGDFVWEDINGDGTQIGETLDGVPGVTVSLTDCSGADVTDFDGNPVGSTVTDGLGAYGFSNLLPGSYKVVFEKPTGFSFTVQGVGDDALDSNADVTSGMSECVTLASGENNPTIDAGLVPLPEQGLGDFLWHDLNANGIQDSGEPGLQGYRVSLYDNATCSGSEFDYRFTGPGGLYLFDDLATGDYCVQFDLPRICELGVGDAKFSASGQSTDDEEDSDVDSIGRTGQITLAAGQRDLSWDAGVYCPAKIGDFVWEDCNRDGLQNDAGQCAGGDGVVGVEVRLRECVNGNVIPGAIDTVYTGSDGMYMFTVVPGDYNVRFVAPSGRVFTLRNQGTSDAIDSDAAPGGSFPGGTGCFSVPSNEFDRTWDAGLEPPLLEECSLSVEKTCEVPTPPPPGLEECDGRLTQFTLIWNGGGTITASGLPNDAPGGVVNQGDTVTFFGPFSDNDVYVDISGDVSGRSNFHTSCSDDDMDGETDDQAFPHDCGKMLGDGKKNKSEFINDWILDGLVDKDGDTVDCSPVPQPPSDACEFVGTGTDVTYSYLVKNIGTPTVSDISVIDDKLGAVNGSPIASLTAGQEAVLVDSAFISQTTTNTVTVTGTAGNAVCTAEDSATVTITRVPKSCATHDKPTSLTFDVTGSCSDQDNFQDGKAKCTGPDLAGDITSIKIEKDADKIGYEIIDGDTFRVYQTDKVGERLQSTVKFTINGSQYHEVHTSCSQPLAEGDLLGGIELVEYVPASN